MDMNYYLTHFNGPFIDLALMAIGGIAGNVLRKIVKTTDDFKKNCQLGIALSCILVGISGISVENPITCTVALLTGPVVGTALNLDGRFTRFVDKIGNCLSLTIDENVNSFRESFIGFLMLTLIGTLSVNGPIQNVVQGCATLMILKGCLDGITAFDYVLSKNKKAVFWAIPIVFLFDCLITGGVALSSVTIFESNINDIATCGSVLLIILGMNLMGICNIKTINLLPTLLTATVLSVI